MNIIKLEELAWRYRRLLALLVVIIVIQFFELALLYYKYNIFTGGFLQPYSYQTTNERIVFILVSLWFDFVFFGLIAFLWFIVTDRLDKHGVYIYYIFAVFTMLIMGGWLGFKYKVLSYFGDTLNFLILQNLGGGNIQDALLYASSEIALFTGVVCIVIVFFIISTKFLKKFNYLRSFPINKKQQTELLVVVIIAIALTPLISLIVSSNQALWYGMKKKTSFYVINNVLDKLSDLDFDGYGSFSFPRDKEVFNAHVYPGALDEPENGIDEDGFLGDASSQDIEIRELAEIVPKHGKHIILIVLESARADLVNKKINGSYVAPVLSGLAKEGTFVEYAYSHTGYTTTSLKAIFNSNLIGLNNHNLITFLQKAGYQISIISGEDESFGNVATDVGMKKDGVDYFDARTAIDDRVFVSKESGSLRLSEERVVEQFKIRAAQLDFTKPQFIYLNFQAAHFPYSHPKMTKRIIQDLIPRSEILNENKDWVEETYWNAISNADWAVGEVINELKERKILNKTTLVILADHGESLFEDGFLGHGHAINDSQTRIPLIINDSNIILNEAIGQVDVAEITIRSALDINKPWDNKDKVVFQMVGNLNQPILIAHVKNGGQRTLFDFRTEQVFFSEDLLWKDYKEALANPKYKDRIERLLKDWENLRWNAHLIRIQNNSK